MQLRQLEYQNKNKQAVRLGDIQHSIKIAQGKKEIFNKVEKWQAGRKICFLAPWKTSLEVFLFLEYLTVHMLQA